MTKFAAIPEIAGHIERTIGPVHIVFHERVSDELHIDVHHVRASFLRRYEVLVTSGMSAFPMSVPEEEGQPRYAEIVALLPKGWPLSMEAFEDECNYWPVRLVKDLARYPFKNKTWFGFGHTVGGRDENGEFSPFASNTKLCAAAILPSSTLGEKSWCMKRQGSEDVFFWTAVPLHASEVMFKMEHGIDALLELFDKHGVDDRIDPARPSVV